MVFVRCCFRGSSSRVEFLYRIVVEKSEKIRVVEFINFEVFRFLEMSSNMFFLLLNFFEWSIVIVERGLTWLLC